MDITPVYELRTRLRAAAIAGTNLIPEDFRLKKAVEALQPLEAAAPVFKKIGALSREIISPGDGNKEETLIDCITLVDALLCTQGVVEVDEEIQPVSLQDTGGLVVNASYSEASAITNALLNTGEGRYNYLADIHKTKRELFNDYRIRPALVKALGDNFAEIASLAGECLKESGKSVVPLLKKDFDPAGKKEMLRRLNIIEEIAGAEENQFYVNMLPDSSKDIKCALIYALRHSSDNARLLSGLVKTERGKAKKMACIAFAHMECKEAGEFFQGLLAKKPGEALEYLLFTDTPWSSVMIRDYINLFVEKLENIIASGGNITDGTTPDERELFVKSLWALNGKDSHIASGCLNDVIKLALTPGMQDVQFANLYNPDPGLNLKDVKELELIYIIAGYMQVFPVTCKDEELCMAVLDIYEKYKGTQYGAELFPAAVIAKMITEEDCTGWIKEESGNNPVMPFKLAEGLRNSGWSQKENAWVFEASVYNSKENTRCVHKAKQQVKGSFTRLIMDMPGGNLDFVLAACIPDGDKEYEKAILGYFYKQAVNGMYELTSDMTYCKYLYDHGFAECDGLAEGYLEYLEKKDKKPYLCHFRELTFFLMYLPGNNEAKDAECLKMVKLIQDKKLESRIEGFSMKILKYYLPGLSQV